MKQCTIAFIGGGNMARSLIGGLISNQFTAENIHVSDANTEALDNLSSRYNVKTFTDNLAAIADADVIILAVKPQQLQSVIRQIAPAWQQDKLLISIAAGIRLNDISRWLDFEGAAIVRAMPNTPSLVQAGATALCANDYVTSAQHELAESMLRAVGLALWISDEKQMDAVTALSGSGPAYFFLVLEALQTAGMELGLPEETARLLALETSFGAAKMALESDESACVLRQRVTSPGGTTERALDVFEQGDLRGLFKQALTAAAQRADELAEQLGQDYD
ncbi:MAG TPA: pyrroline-5-carboxylate reductase [Methylophaga aminisulfidivorans]|jgi:pyrroline-5-carboxylate reductase|uniref:pyrroline-5-carboxylate reductase n=1 Tax=Methylophaga TaxID=40222 RepID=UPI00177A7414|nr:MULTISPECIES: pyrroline-5-carboxylate reductase [Methylophaga]WVI85112.1 pyrroline-5-carboxylate reductase [Methylophaga thalassica]HIC45250.1 pyrroline-5-carboxylate reductase [Methylophaga sp.]HIM38549.1 pyrroline-5-carboxylate reductase [Methylophaga aminisulfidivorans]